MSAPSHAVRLLASGYPSRLRDGKLIAMLQAFIDDSAGSSGSRPLVMSAFVLPVADWESFSDDWDAVLQSDPPIEYFKMVEAQNRRGQFQGWSESKRNQKAFDLANVIQKYRPLSLVAYLNQKAHTELLMPFSPYELSSPYFPLVFVLICGIARLSKMLGANLPCDFVFDRQDNVSKHVNLFFDYIIGSQPKEWAKFISNAPVFRDDRDMLPLQAADLLAWHARRDLEGSYPKEYEGILDILCTPKLNFACDVSDDYLRKWGESMRQVPGVDSVATKSQWNKLIVEIMATGEIPGSA